MSPHLAPRYAPHDSSFPWPCSAAPATSTAAQNLSWLARSNAARSNDRDAVSFLESSSAMEVRRIIVDVRRLCLYFSRMQGRNVRACARGVVDGLGHGGSGACACELLFRFLESLFNFFLSLKSLRTAKSKMSKKRRHLVYCMICTNDDKSSLRWKCRYGSLRSGVYKARQMRRSLQMR